jgi:hypothetical protein
MVKKLVTEKGVGGVGNFCKKNDMDENDKGDEMNLMG